MLKTCLAVLLLLVVSPARSDDALSPAANGAFLAANAAKPGTITRPSGLQYRVLRNGFGKRPGGNDIVRLSYSMKLIDGRTVDSTAPTLPTAVAMATVNIRGLSEALQLMHEGDRWQVVMPAALGFGVHDAAGGTIPANQTLVMDLTLVSAAPQQPGQTLPDNPLSVWSNGREMGGALTIHPAP
ncbi:MAG: FKBP-type peptidylprolyl cis-trans isomerase [Alphaproteobacteria bacterium]|nr:FKBP-type peptidylprolyl cis-trans isomerase [Alphaproteobacteria bacterium]